MPTTREPEEKPQQPPPPTPVPPMPVHLPTPDAEHPRSTPGQHDPRQPIDPRLPPEPGNDPNP